MPITTAPPLLLALGARIFLNSFVFSNPFPSTSDFLLNGLFGGVLAYYALTEIPQLAIPVAVGVGAKTVYDYLDTSDNIRCMFTVVGVALGVLATDMLSRLFENGLYAPPAQRARTTSTSHARDAYEPGRRLRLVSFGHSDPDRARRHQRVAEESRVPPPEEPRAGAVTPALTYTSNAPSISLESVPSSIDPEGRMTPHERVIAVLRARASLADSERRRFKEERKWALAQGNTARANQLAWQVKRYAALMESFHREADAKLVEAARAADRQQSSVPFPDSGAGPSASRPRRDSESRRRTTSGSNSNAAPSGSAPLVSVTVGGSRSRKRSSGASSLRPAIRVSGRDVNVSTR